MVTFEAVADGFHQRVGVETFDGTNFGAVAGRGKRNAGSRRATVDEYRASTANALFAADMGAARQRFLADEISQMGARFDCARNLLSV